MAFCHNYMAIRILKVCNYSCYRLLEQVAVIKAIQLFYFFIKCIIKIYLLCLCMLNELDFLQFAVKCEIWAR